jgi:hypothetical protein
MMPTMNQMHIAVKGCQRGRLAQFVSAALFLVIVVLAEPVDGRASQRSPFAGFPLYKDVSGNGPYATLDEGQLSSRTRWGAYASRVGAGRRGYEQPCLSLARITRYGEYGDVHGCAPLVPTATYAIPNYLYIAGTYQTKPNGPFVGETVMALSFGTTVQSVVLKYTDGGQLRRRTRFFNPKQQRKTHLPPFRYIAMALQDDVCVETVVGFSRSGSEVFSAEPGLCPDL